MQQSQVTSLLAAQDDGESVVLPNLCPDALVEMDDGTERLRCFSVLTKQPHSVPPESWSVVSTPQSMPDPSNMANVSTTKFLTDHVTRGIMGDNAIQLSFNKQGALTTLRLLPSGTGPAQKQWEAQANKMIE